MRPILGSIRTELSHNSGKSLNTSFRGISATLRLHLRIVVLVTLKIVLHRSCDREKGLSLSLQELQSLVRQLASPVDRVNANAMAAGGDMQIPVPASMLVLIAYVSQQDILDIPGRPHERRLRVERVVPASAAEL